VRSAGNRAIERNARDFSQTLRMRSPEYQRRAATAPMVPGPGLGSGLSGLKQILTLGGGGGVRDAIARAILLNTTGEQ